jgi:excisionase family DNA binding protein
VWFVLPTQTPLVNSKVRPLRFSVIKGFEDIEEKVEAWFRDHPDVEIFDIHVRMSDNNLGRTSVCFFWRPIVFWDPFLKKSAGIEERPTAPEELTQLSEEELKKRGLSVRGLVTTETAAEFLQLSESQVRRLVSLGKITGFRVRGFGNRLFIVRQSVVEYKRRRHPFADPSEFKFKDEIDETDTKDVNEPQADG